MQGLRARVSPLDDGVIMYRESSDYSVASIRVMMDALSALGQPYDHFVTVVDIRGVPRPDAPRRAEITRSLNRMQGRLVGVGFVADQMSWVMNVAAKFIYRDVSVPFAFHDSIADAQAAVEAALLAANSGSN